MLTAFAFAGAASASPPPAAVSQPGGPQADLVAPGDRLLMQAASQLERRASVTARLRHQIAISGQQLYGAGSYSQQGSGEDLKVRLELQIAGQDAQFLQVTDNRYIWIDRTLPTGRSVSRIDLRQLRADPSLTGGNFNDMKPGEASWSATQSELISYTGGLPMLLASLKDNFDFLPPQAMRLALAPPLVAEATNLPVWAVVGHWKPAQLDRLAPRPPGIQAGKNAFANQLQQLPERMPQEVLLLVGQADLFPYRIEYRRLETSQLSSSEGSSIPYQLSVHPLVVLELSDVKFDSQLPPGQFDYSPGTADWVDQTSVILDRLRQQHQAKVAVKTEGGASAARQ
ncbi:MAG TPA: hypothetical protein VH107_14535 [Lacipirellulaceae bacterium]|nr:hypothetical protein [Lacipirellulaceae bacterium]